MSTEFVIAIPHPNALTPCHLAIVPRRHVSTFYDLDVQEQHVIWDVLAQLQRRIADKITVEGFDVGFVDARTGSDPAFHAYVHLLPRIAGQHVTRTPGAEWVDLGFVP